MANKKYVDRSARIDSHPDKFRNFTRYSGQSSYVKDRPAQFVDVSETGMRLISRHPSKIRSGDVINVEFTLPGNKEKVVSKARVVRLMNEFEFAVRFIHIEETERESFRRAVEGYARHLREAPIKETVARVFAWMNAHREGLIYGTVGFAIAATAGTWIFMHSDEYLGTALRAWGPSYPKEWFLEYYQKFTK
jgi:hypothetical protein